LPTRCCDKHGRGEVWAAIEGLYQSGKTKMIGISNVTAEQLALLCERAKHKPMVVQNRCYAALGQFRDEGLIRMDGRTITISNIEGLFRLVS
jgi:diketogulonate reductase-like aldo/keto reductase